MHTKNHETPKGRGSSLTIKLESESNGFNAWVRCASGNVLTLLYPILPCKKDQIDTASQDSSIRWVTCY